MITKVNNSIVNLKNLFIEIFLNKTNKVTNVADGSVLNAVAFGAAKIAQKAIKDIAITEAKIFPETATGDFLDKAAALYGVSQRKGALGSSTYVRVYAKPNTKYGFDNYFLSKNGLRFSIDEETIVDSTGYAYIKVRSINAGYITNVDANSITNIVPIPDGHIECTNEYMATGGRDSEDDETFRLRIKTNLNILSKGTLEYFTQVFQNIDDRILRVMNVGLGEDGIYEIYLVTQNGIYLTDDELTSLLEKSKSYFGLSELNLQGDVIGIRLKNVEWFYIGSERGIDFRVELDPDYEVADVRKNIQVGITKYLDFRFWKAGKIVQWDDLLDVVKKTEGVKYVPDEYFFPYYDQGVPLNQLPRVKGFIMKDLEGKVLYDSNSTLSPMFYPKEEEDLFRGLSDTTLSLRQAVYFFVRDEEGRPVKGARITISSSSILTDDSGKAVISLVNGAYDYIINADLFTENQGSFVVLNGSITINAVLIFAPYVAHFTVVNTRDEVLEGAAIVINEVNTYTTNINGEANISLKVGSYTYSVDILGYKSIVGSVEIVDSDIYIPVTMQDQEWIQTIFVREDISKEPIKGVIVTVDKNNYITDSEGKVELSLINGTYSVEINAVGYNDKQTTIRVNNSPATTIVSMTLIKFNVTIVVYDDNNKLVSGVNVIINEGEYIMQTSKNGEVEFKLTNGTYRLQILSSSYDDIESTFQVQNSDIGFNYTLQPKHYIATMIILDSNNEAIKDAIVTVDSDSQLTNELGVVKFSLYNGIYPYTVEKLGYYAGLGNITIDKSDISNVIKLTSQPWDIILFVKDGDTYLTEANININGQSYVTDSEGKVELSLINGTYSYTITKLGYSDVTGNLVVENKNTTVDIAMYLKPYTTTFTVISRGNRVSGATIVCEGVSVITNDQGIAEIGLVNGDHSYTVTKSGYVNYSGLITVNNNEQNIIIDFEAIVYSCSIVVKDTDTNKNLVSSVSVVVGGETKWTNENGQVEFSLSSGVYNVILSKEGYLEKTTIIEISSATSIELSIDKIYQLSFIVSGTERSFLSDATIVITGDAVVPDSPTSEKKKILVTDSEGKTSTIDVINGVCSYGVSHSGYSSETGVLTIQDGSLIKEIDLIYGIKTIFVVKDQESNIIEGATILIDNVDSQLTDETGEASFYLSNGTHTYLISKTGYKGVLGSVTVNDEQQTIDIGLVLGAEVTFNSVLDGAVLPGMTIVIKDGDSFVTQGIINNQGQFVVRLISGTYTVICGDDETSFANNTQQITVGTEDFSVTFEMKLYIYRSLTVFVKYRTTVIEDASIYITGTVNGVKYDNVIKTDSEGKAVFTKIINGDYSCLITKEGYQDYSDTITVSGNTEVTKTINQYHTVILTYTDFRGIAISGLSINREGLEAKQTDSKGQVTYINELDGSFVVSFTGVDPYQSNSTEIIVSGEDVSQTIKLDSIYTVNITVKDGQNDIVPNIVVNVYRAGGIIASGTTNSSGIVSFRLVASYADCYARIVDTSEFISAGSVAYFSVVDGNIDLSLGCYFMITFRVTAKGNYISSSSYLVGAEIIEIKDDVEGESHSTNSSGIATWSLPYDEGISYGCKLVRTSNWNEASGTFSVSKSSHIAELIIVGDMLYTFTFNVKRSGSNISNVEILLRTSIGYWTTKYTDTSGNATFDGVATYSLGSPIDVYYEVSASDNSYYKSIGTTYISSPITSNRNINISVVPLYDLRFREVSGLSGVSISLTGSTSGYGTTDSSGICSFDKLESTSLNYTATKNGYITVEGTITLTGASEVIIEEFLMEKDEYYGIYVCTTTGTLIRPSEWKKIKDSTSEVVDCIAVVTKESQFGILCTSYYLSSFQWIDTDNISIPSVFCAANDNINYKIDYSGQANTKTLAKYGDSIGHNNIGLWCYPENQTAPNFPSGRNGYCGSSGEWNIIFENKAKISYVVKLIGGYDLDLPTTDQWTSTQFNDNEAFRFMLDSGNCNPYTKTDWSNLRPLCSIHYTSGIYIQGTDSKLYTTSEWSSRPSGVSANCVAVVINDDIEFGIALKDAGITKYWGTKGVLLDGIYTNTKTDVAATIDFGGFANTQRLLQIENNAVAARLCNNYIFPNGKKGYLGSAGEWRAHLTYINEIETALSVAGGVGLRENYTSVDNEGIRNYWTSTQYDATYAIAIGVAGYAGFNGYYKDLSSISSSKGIRVRPFVHL